MDLQTKVLICGAGPTGLMMACQLKRFGVACIIIDEKKGITIESRALAVQARSLEIYDQMGIIEKVLKEGEITTGINFIVNGKLVQQLNLQNGATGLSPYSFLYILEQSKNEKILYEHLIELGGEVHWGYALSSFSQGDAGINAVVRDKEGKENSIIADWLVAADGARSFVRHALQVPFEGETYENIFFVADTAINWPWKHEKLSLSLTDKMFVGLFPMKGDDRFRVIGMLPKQFYNMEIHDFDQIKDVVRQDMKIDVPFTDTNWFSVYKIHHRCVDNFRKDNIFLAGDSAHVHSPVGGQGMNTGLQDAYNLAWKLALVLQKNADVKLLDSYNEERIPVARRLVKTTDRAFSFITSQKKFDTFLRLKILPVFIKRIFRLKMFRVFAFKNVSQIAIHYKRSSLSYNLPGNLLAAGKFVPFVEINSKKISEILRFTGFTILIFGSDPALEEKEAITKLFDVPIQIIVIAKTEINAEAFKKFKVKASGVFVIRPDSYIGFASGKFSNVELKKYFMVKLFLKSKQTENKLHDDALRPVRQI